MASVSIGGLARNRFFRLPVDSIGIGLSDEFLVTISWKLLIGILYAGVHGAGPNFGAPGNVNITIVIFNYLNIHMAREN